MDLIEHGDEKEHRFVVLKACCFTRDNGKRLDINFFIGSSVKG